MDKHIRLEICSDSVEAALTAQLGGAQRIELCADLPHGGITPSYGTIKTVREKLNIKVFVLIRPRSGDFTYNDNEFETIKNDIRICGELGCDGVVVGILNRDGRTIDVERSRELAQLAHSLSMEVTFHRAFDCCGDMAAELEKVIEAGYDRILTSGGEPTASEGSDMLNKLVNAANGRIIIMPGSGVRPGNLASLAEKTGAHEFHGSFQIVVPQEKMDPILEKITGQHITMRTDQSQIEQAIQILNNL